MLRRGVKRERTCARVVGRRPALLAGMLVTLLVGGVGEASADLPVGSDQDVTAPQASSMTVSPLSVDVRGGTNATFTATLVATDDLSGVASAWAYYYNPSGRSIYFSFGPYNRTSGDAKNGTYKADASVTPLTANGTYTFAYLQIYDTVGNYRVYSAQSGVATPSLTVQSNADAVAPVVTGVSVSPNPLDVSAGIEAATVEAQITDDVSGVASVYGVFSSPSGRQAASFFASPVNGEPGVARGTTTVARYSEAGDWRLTYLCAYDKAGNQECFNDYSTPTITTKFPLVLSIVSDPADAGKPGVAAFRVSPAAIDVTNAGQTVTTEFDVTDDLAGVQFAYIRFASPSTAGASPPVIQRTGWVYAPSIYQYHSNGDGTYTIVEDDSKRLLQGTLSAQTFFPRYDRSGEWQVAEVCVVDNVNWRTCYSAQTTPSLGTLGPTTIAVAWNRTPVVAVTGITETSYVKGSEPTPGCNVSDLEDGTITGVQPVVTGPDANGVVTVTCSYTDSGGVTGTATKTYTVTTPTNVAPTVDAKGPYAGAEGAAIAVSGIASDADRDALEVTWSYTTVSAQPGTTCGFGDAGALATTITCTDNGIFTLTLTVDDGVNAPVTSTASLTVNNVKPTVTIASLTGTGGVACLAGNTVTLGFSWTDPAAGRDTYGYAVNWGDGSADAVATGVDSPVAGLSHTYGAGGPYTITVAVDDEDPGAGGSATSTAFSFHYNTGLGFLQPLNMDGTSNFKLGSTLPVKVRVTDCSGALVSNLTPKVSLARVGSGSGTVNEPVVVDSVADVANDMRYADGYYIYNLSTKNSTFASPPNGPLALGRYELKVTAPAIPPIKVNFDILR